MNLNCTFRVFEPICYTIFFTFLCDFMIIVSFISRCFYRKIDASLKIQYLQKLLMTCVNLQSKTRNNRCNKFHLEICYTQKYHMNIRLCSFCYNLGEISWKNWTVLQICSDSSESCICHFLLNFSDFLNIQFLHCHRYHNFVIHARPAIIFIIF